jgi:hypothetical protein
MHRIALACAALLLCGSAANADVIINPGGDTELPASTVGGVTVTTGTVTAGNRYLTASIAAGTGVPGIYSVTGTTGTQTPRGRAASILPAFSTAAPSTSTAPSTG